MKTCDVCNRNLNLIRFRYQSGMICRKCYEKASKNCTEPVRQLDFDEVKKRCTETRRELDLGEFEITDRIGNYILIDKKREKFCIVNNRLQVRGHQPPEMIALKDIQYCRICCDSSQNLGKMWDDKELQSGFIKFLRLEVYMNSVSEPKNIIILSSPVRIHSFAFRKSMRFMHQIVEYLKSNYVEFRFT